MLKQALCWEVEDFKRRPGRPQTTLERRIVKKDLSKNGTNLRQDVEASAVKTDMSGERPYASAMRDESRSRSIHRAP